MEEKVMFRKLTQDELLDFQQWADENFTPNEVDISPLWHPVIRKRCHEIMVDYYESLINEIQNK